MFDFVHSKFNYLHNKLMDSFSHGAEIYDYKVKKRSTEEEDNEEGKIMGSCINMHGLKLVDLDPKTGNFKEFLDLKFAEGHKDDFLKQNF